MGQKVNPIGFRLAVNRDWRSKWYASPQEMPAFLHSDLKIRNYVKKKLQFAAVSKIVIERAWNSIRVTIYTARPGIVIGRKGAEIEKMTEEISKMAQGKQIKIDIQEIKTPELDAQLVAENVALVLPVLPFILNKWDSLARHRERGGGSTYKLYRAAGRKRRTAST